MSNPPTPDAAFRWTAESWGHGLRCEPLEQVAQHVFTTRQLPLRGQVDDTRRAWVMAAEAIGVGPDTLLRVRQVHGAGVRLVHGDTPPDATLFRAKPDGDAVVSGARGTAPVVLVADCVPVLLADPDSGAVAAVHAGWRGMAAGVLGAAVRTLATAFGATPARLVAAVGPSIGPCCYEVGPELVGRFLEVGRPRSDVERWFRPINGGLRLDLWQATRDQLAAAGLDEAHVHVCGLCTKTWSTVFDSYRADGERAGRMAAMVAVSGAARL